MSDTQASKACASCKKPGEANGTALLNCAACHLVSYCNKDCQKADWKAHKKNCTFQPKPKPANHRHPLTPENTFGVSTKSTLDKAPDEHVFKVLIDSFRMRVEDEYNFRSDVMEDSALGGGNPGVGFMRYLKQAETRGTILPSWWSEEKRYACVAYGSRTGHWWSLRNAVEKSDIQEKWGMR